MPYADYTYYKNTFCGTMPEEEYNHFSHQASAYILQITFGRAERAMEGKYAGNVKDACCAISDAYKLNEQGGGVVSETVGKHTKNYAAGVSTAPTEGQRLHQAASLYLAGTGLMYRGC